MNGWRIARMVALLGLGVGLVPAVANEAASEPYTRAWVARYNGPANAFDQIRALAVAPDGDLVLAGQTRGLGEVFELLVWRLTSDGAPSPRWPDEGAGQGVRRFRSLVGHAGAEAVVVASDGSVMVGGFRTTQFQFEDYLVLKYNATGQPSSTWADQGAGVGVRTYDRLGGPDQVRALALTPLGRLIVTGRSAGVSSVPGTVTWAYLPNGVTLYGVIYPTTGSAATEPVSVLPLADEGALLLARTVRPNGRYAYLVLRYTAAGGLSTAWPGSTSGVRLYTGINDSNSEPAGLALRPDGAVVVTGRSADASGRQEAATVAWAADGTLLWTRRYGAVPGGQDGGVAVVALPDGDSVVLAESEGAGTATDFALLRYTAAGEPSPAWPDVGAGVGVRRWNGPANGVDRPRALAADRLGNVYATGETARGDGRFGLVVLKWTADGRLAWADSYVGPAGDVDQPLLATMTASDQLIVAGSSTGVDTGQDAVAIGYTQQLPRLGRAPGGLLAPLGSSVVLDPQVTGSAALTATWRRAGQVVGDDSILSLGTLDDTTAGRYEVLLDDGFNRLRGEYWVAGLGLAPGVPNLRLDVVGPGDQALRLDSSLDLRQWNLWQQFVLPAAPPGQSARLQWIIDPSAARSFFRLRTP